MNPRLTAGVLDFSVETPHNQHRPGGTQQAHLGSWQTHAASERHAEVLIDRQVRRLRVTGVGLEDVGGCQSLPVDQEESSAAPSQLGHRPVQINQQLVLQAGHGHAHLAVPHGQRDVLALGDALVELW